MSSDFLGKASLRVGARDFLSSLASRDPAGYRTINQQRLLSSVTPNSGVPSDGAQIQFYIPSSNLCLDAVVMQIAIANSSGTASQINPFTLIRECRFFSGQGSVLLGKMTGLQIYNQICQLAFEEWESIAYGAGMNSATFAPSTNNVVASTTTTFYVPLLGALWEQFSFALSLNSSSTFYLEIDLVTFANCCEVSGTAGNLSYAACQFWLFGISLPPGAQNRIASLVQNGVSDVQCFNYQYSQQNQNLAASSQYQFQLPGITGMVTDVFIYVLATPTTGAAAYTPVNGISQMQFLDSSGNPICGGNQMPTKLLVSNLAADFNENNHYFSTLQYIVPYTFQHDAQKSLGDYSNSEKMEVSGYSVWDGQYQIQFQTPSGLSSANYQIIVLAKVLQRIKISNGVMSPIST
jgi:hypothetical protein